MADARQAFESGLGAPAPRRAAAPATWRRSLRALGFALVLLAPQGCAGFLDKVERAAERFDRLVQGDRAATAPEGAGRPAGEAERLHRAGLAARAAGREAAAVEHFRQAAERGHPAATTELGLALGEGRGVARDEAQAARWLNLAADRGEPRAQYMVGAAFYAGAGVKRDPALAARYLGAAAVQGHADAQFLLAKAFANGDGVPKDLAWAARWYGKAAHQGHGAAQFAYGAVIAAGHGLPADPREGYRWILLAERAGQPDAATLRAALARRLEPEALEAAEAAADAFRPAPNSRFADRPTVRYVQHTLGGLGYAPGPVDGYLGPRTRSAIRGYQSAEKLKADGRLSPALLEHILKTSRDRR